MQKRLKKIQLGTEINVDIKNNIGMLDNIEGNSYQENKESINKLNPKIIRKTGSGYGVTWKFDEETSILTLNGTSENNVNLWFAGNYGENQKTLFILKAGTYTISEGICLFTNTTRIAEPGKVTFKENRNVTAIRMATNLANTTFENKQIPIFINEGEETNFVKYENSPSLDYPSEVEAVGDNINLISNSSNDWEQGTLNGTTGQPQDSSARIRLKEYIDVRNIKSIACNLQNSNYKVVSIHFFGKDYSFITTSSTLYGYGNFNLQNMDLPKNTCYIKVIVSKTDVNSEIEISEIEQCKLKIESGSISTPYSPYNQGSTEIVTSNKNILNWLDLLNKIGITLPYTKEVSGITFKIDEKGTISVKGTSTSTINLYLTGSYTSKVVKYIINNAKDTIASGFNNNWSKGLAGVFFDNSSETNIHLDFYDSKNNKCTKDKFNVTGIMFALNSGVTIDETYNLMLEKGTITTDFIEHKGDEYVLPIQKPFHKIGKYTDGFVRLGNQWYEQHYIKEYIFTGTETYTKSTQYSNDNWLCAYLINESRVMDVKYAAPMYATRFKKIGLYSDILDENCIFSSTQFHVRVSTNYLTENTTEAYSNLLKQWYDEGNPLKVYYISDEPELIKCTERQNSILNALSNIQLINGINHIYTSDNIKPTLKFLYYDKTEKDNDVYVFDKNENLIAVFDKDDEDTIINPQVHDLQNTESTFSFSLPLNSAKWQQINNAENLYYTDNKMFSTNFDGCFTSDVNENNEDLVSIIAYERQKLLERMYVRAWNSEDGFENVDTFMCVILSKGNLELKNNGELVNSTHLKGTSGYVLDGLLYGTGWTTGVCDVEGEFDFETDQVDIFNNILKVQEIWGGILVIDSVNKIIEHRDETKFLPYDGFEVRYQKNMQSLEKIYNNKIITELCPLGEGGLNIKSVNGGSEWLTNYTYSSSRLQGIENNADITDPVQLKAWGERKLKDLCKPSKELNVKAILLNQIEGFEHEVIGLNDIVDVIDYQFIVGDIEQLRVVEYTHKLWDNSDAEIVLSDITLDSTDIFKKTVSATDTINNGTLTTNKVVDFFKNGQSLNQTLTQIGTTIEQNKSDLIKTDEEIEATLTNVKTVIDELNHTILSQQEIIENLEITIEGLKNQLTVSGGNNLIRNSVGIFDNEYWEGSIIGYTDTDVQQNNVSKNAIFLQNGSIMQEILRLKNGFYNISFNYKKLLESAVCKVKINDNIEIDLDNTSWDSIDKQLEILDNYFRIEFISDSNNACYISDLILIVGKNKQTWTQNINETTSDTVSIGQGIRVDSDKTNTYTRIDSDGNRTFNKATNQAVMEATDKGINAENAIVRTQAEITGVLQQKVGDQVWGALL